MSCVTTDGQFVNDGAAEHMGQTRAKAQKHMYSGALPGILDRLAGKILPSAVSARSVVHTDLMARIRAGQAVEVVQPETEKFKPWEDHRAKRLLSKGKLAIGALKSHIRVKDLAVLLAVAGVFLARQFWRLPRSVKCLSLGGVALYLGIAMLPEGREEAVLRPSAALVTTVPVLSDQRDDWKTVSNPMRMFNLEATEFDRQQPGYRLLRTSSGARQDVLTLGNFDPQKSKFSAGVHLEFYPSQPMLGDSLYLDSVRRVAQSGLSLSRVAESGLMETKFGMFEVADAVLNDQSASRNCLVFRHAAGPVPFQIHGWMCGTRQVPLDRVTLNCVLDRVDLISAGEDLAFKSYFAGVERNRRNCGGAKGAGAKTSWLDAGGKIPVLKAGFTEKGR